mgnify:CR=1 FL=1
MTLRRQLLAALSRSLSEHSRGPVLRALLRHGVTGPAAEALLDARPTQAQYTAAIFRTAPTLADEMLAEWIREEPSAYAPTHHRYPPYA